MSRARCSLVCLYLCSEHVESARVDIPRAQVRSYNVRPRHLCKVMGTNLLRKPLGMCAKLHLIKCFGEPYDSFYLLPPKKIPTTAYREAAVGITLSEVGRDLPKRRSLYPK